MINCRNNYLLLTYVVIIHTHNLRVTAINIVLSHFSRTRIVYKVCWRKNIDIFYILSLFYTYETYCWFILIPNYPHTEAKSERTEADSSPDMWINRMPSVFSTSLDNNRYWCTVFKRKVKESYLFQMPTTYAYITSPWLSSFFVFF